MQAKQKADEEMRKSLLEKKDKVAKQMIILENEFDKIKAGYSFSFSFFGGFGVT